MPRGGACPECGAPVAVALAGDALRFADPQWLGQLERAGRLAGAAITVGVALSAAIVAASAVGWPDLPVLIAGALACGLVPLALLLVAAWRMTAPNPALAGRENWRSPRRVVRGAVIGTVATAALTLGAVVLAPSSGAALWIQGLGAPLGLLGVTGALAYAQYVRELALRADERFTANRALVYGWGFFLAWLFFAPSAAAVALGVVAGAYAMAPGALGMLACGALTLLLPAYLVRQLHSTRAAAETFWQDAGRPAPAADADPTRS